jgi:hypothetical protein
VKLKPKKTLKLSGKPCEFCGTPLSPKSEFTVCQTCDQQLEFAFMKEDRALDRAWARKHRCIDCGKGLTRDRARICQDCAPSCYRESECPYEMIPSPRNKGEFGREESEHDSD